MKGVQQRYSHFEKNCIDYGLTNGKIPLSIMFSSIGHIVVREVTRPVGHEGTRTQAPVRQSQIL